MIPSKTAKLIAAMLSIFFVCISANAKPKEIIYELSCSAQPQSKFYDLKHGLVVSTTCDVDNSGIWDPSQLTEKQRKATLKKLHFVFKPNVSDFFEESFKKYVSKSGFQIGYDRNGNYTLKAKLKEFKCTDGAGGAPCTVVIEWQLLNPERATVLDGTAKGRKTLSPGQTMPDVLDVAYGLALADIDWEGIAYYLGNSTSKKDEKVTGDGNTDLEHTVIRWNIISNPLGADVSWRVVSSTPEVKNTNSKYVGTTPYETTESFDIKGMTYNNSGNIQIEKVCEKAGYLAQSKRFNLLQAIDQKEISIKFNLVKDSAE